MACFPQCSPWCDCVNDQCVPSAVTINALRLTTQDGRAVGASAAAGGILVARTAVPAQTETFLLAAPTAYPLRSGDPLSLVMCNAAWASSGLMVLVDHTVVTFGGSHSLDPGQKSAPIVTYEVGGTGASVLVSAGLSPGYPAYPGSDPAERIFAIVKLVNGAPAPVGTPVNSGDLVAIRIDSNRGKTFFFRVLGAQSGAGIDGDGTVAGQAGTAFVVTFNEVRTGLGWRPATIVCQSCAQVTVKVTDGASGQVLAGATAVAQIQNANHPYQGTTSATGRVVLADSAGRTCVPAGQITITVTHNRHQTRTVTATVPGSGAIEVDVALACTQVSGKVVDSAGSAIPGKPVFLRDASGHVILDENGNPYATTTAADGSFAFNCVQQGFVQVWTTADPSQMQHTKVIGPEGWTTVTIVVQVQTCGDLVGQVIDADTGQPIAGATVTEAGGRQTTTDANGNFRFQCLRPAGSNSVVAEAPGYGFGLKTGSVPTSGTSAPVVIPLHKVVVDRILIRLDWGMSPSDLDSHLSGPDGAGARFHCFFVDKTPTGFVTLDVDDVTSFGPETITISQDTPGSFEPGDYHYWVHDYTTTTFAGSNASVTVSVVDAQGSVNQLATYLVANASGDQADDIWHVVDLAIDASGNATLTVVQTLSQGTSATVL
jgi:uncharacterized protein YfaP (DUF2135 family)